MSFSNMCTRNVFVILKKCIFVICRTHCRHTAYLQWATNYDQLYLAHWSRETLCIFLGIIFWWNYLLGIIFCGRNYLLIMDIHSLTAEMPVGYVSDFYRQSMALVSGPCDLGTFSKRNLDAMFHGKHRYNIPCRHIGQSASIKSDNFTRCLIVGTPKYPFRYYGISLFYSS